MVVFTCNHCGESLKKGVVDKHKFRCSKNISVSCMDCFKDFNEETFNAHTQCITEAERYSGKDYKPKANQNKGQKKQEAWVDMVRGIGEKKKNLSSSVLNILQTISSYENIPRKKAKFLNFMKNSFRYMKQDDLEAAWTLLEEAMKENKAESQPQANGTKNEANGIKNETNGVKRKLEDEINGEHQNGKKAKIEEPPEEESQKFNWGETIKSILLSKNNEIGLKKLKKKVLNRYQKFGGEISDKIEKKFNKKLKKLQGVVLDDEHVKLIE